MRAVRVACQRLHRQLLCDSSFAAERLRARSSCSLTAMDVLARILGPTTPAHGLLGTPRAQPTNHLTHSALPPKSSSFSPTPTSLAHASRQGLRAVQCCGAAVRSRHELRKLHTGPPCTDQHTSTELEALAAMHALQETLPQLHQCTVLPAEAGAAELANTAGPHLADAAAAQSDPTVAAEQGMQQAQQQQQQQLQALSLQEMHQLGLPHEVVLIGIDPDCSGAIAVVHSNLQWVNAPASSSSSSNRRSSTSDNTPSSSSNSGGDTRTRSRKGARSTDGSSASNLGTNGHGSTSDSSSSSSNDGTTSISSSSSCTTGQGAQLQAYVTLPAASVRVYDMPVETIITKSKTSTGKARVRRRLDILQAMAIVRQVLQDTVTASPAEPTAAAAAAGLVQLPASVSAGDAAASAAALFGLDSSSSSNDPSPTDTTPTPSSSSSSRILLRAVVEVASIQPGNGSLATLNQGYSVGAWTALLASAGIDVTTVHVLSWKKDMGLLKRDKDCSRDLARGLFGGARNPQDELLRTKNTHGRAEALLLAAWGLGWSAQQQQQQQQATALATAAAQGMLLAVAPGMLPAAEAEAGTAKQATKRVAAAEAAAPIAAQQGPLRATVYMDGGRHMLPVMRQQGCAASHTTPAAAAAAEERGDGSSDLRFMIGAEVSSGSSSSSSSDDEGSSHLLCMPSGLAASLQEGSAAAAAAAGCMLGVVTRADLAARLQPLLSSYQQQQQHQQGPARLLDVQAQFEAGKAALGAKVAAKQAEKEQKAAAKKAAAAERAAEKAAEKAARQAARAEAAAERAAAKAARAAAPRSRKKPVS